MKNLSLRQRLIALSFGVSLCTLFAACVAFFWHELNDSREQEINRVSSAARVVAQSATAAVAFADKTAAEELLTAFRALPSLRLAVLTSANNEELARYVRDSDSARSDNSWQQVVGNSDQVVAHEDYIRYQVDIVHFNETIGHLSVEAETASLLDLMRGTAFAALLVFLIGSTTAYILGAILSARLARPIHELASSMEEISHTKDYRKRLTPRQTDEIGQLFLRFNDMVEQIESRDLALQDQQQTLEQRVADRTAELQRERHQLLGLIKSAPVAIAMLDNQLRYLAHSEKWRTDYGLGDRQILGHTHYEVFPDIPERWKEIHRRVLQGQPAQAAEDLFERADGGQIFLRWAVHPWYHVDGSQGGVVMVTDRIDDLVAAREAALNTARMRSEFLTNISHELRTPLNGIIGFTELLLDEQSFTTTTRSYVDSIQSSGKVLLALINDILDFSKLEQRKLSLESTRFRLSDAVRTATQVFAGQAERKGLSLEISSALTDLSVRGDQLRLQQIFMNLIGNAIKFTTAGSIRVGLESIACIDGELEAKFAVRDTGIGIPKEMQAHIFEAFAQADGSTTRKYGGTGLGLAICVQLVELMRGRIWVESSEGRGATFFFTVRFKQGEEGFDVVSPIPKRPSEELSSDATVTKETILVAEDNPMNQKLVSTILQRAGYAVELVANGKEAVEAVERKSFALVLMDLQMPVMNGLDAIQIIREMERDGQNHVPIIALTAHAFSEHREQCLAAGVDEYLTKPLNRQLLLDTLKRFIEQRKAGF